MSTTASPLTNEKLKDILTDAMVYRGACTDLNTCKKPGIYSISGVVLEQFPNFSWEADTGVLEVETCRSLTYQRITAYRGAFMAIRSIQFGTGEWSQWNLYYPTKTI